MPRSRWLDLSFKMRSTGKGSMRKGVKFRRSSSGDLIIQKIEMICSKVNVRRIYSRI